MTADYAPPVLLGDIVSNPASKARSSNAPGPFVDYPRPNFSRPTMVRLMVRQAPAMATDRQACVQNSRNNDAMWAAGSLAVMALTNSRSVFVHVTGVADYTDNQALSGTVDLATAPVR